MQLIDPNAKNVGGVWLTKHSGDRLEITGDAGIVVWEDGVAITWLDQDGLRLEQALDTARHQISWWDEGDRVGRVYCNMGVASDTPTLQAYAEAPALATRSSHIILAAVPHGDYVGEFCSVFLTTKSSLADGEVEVAPEGSNVVVITKDGMTLHDDLVFVPDTTGEGRLGTSVLYWKEVNYKDIYDRGCLVDLGPTLERVDKQAEWLTALESIKAIGVSAIVSPRTGKPQLDYATFPALCFDEGEYATEDIYDAPARRPDGSFPEPTLQHHKGDKTGTDGINVGSLLSVMMDAIKELSAKNDALEVTATEQGVVIEDLLKRIVELEKAT